MIRAFAMSDNTNSAAAIKRKRSIQMKDFRSADAVKRAMDGQTTVLGTVVGVAYGMTLKEGQLPDGTPKKSKLITGDFQAVNEATGESFEAGSIYLPEYFADEISTAVEKTEGGISFAVQVIMEKNERGYAADGTLIGVAYRYSVIPLLDREKHDPLSMLKAKLAAQGKLGKLPPPPGLALEAPAPTGEAAAGKGGKGKAA